MRRPSTLQSFLANQYAQGNHDSEGTFTLSAERALAKIAENALPFESAWILKVIQAAVAARVDGINILLLLGSTEVELEGDCPWTPEEIGYQLQQLDSSSRPGLDHLIAALRDRLKEERQMLFLFKGDKNALYWDGEELQQHLVDEVPEQTVISVQTANPSLGNLDPATLSILGGQNALISQTVADNAFLCPIPLRVDSKRVDQLSHVVQDGPVFEVPVSQGWLSEPVYEIEMTDLDGSATTNESLPEAFQTYPAHLRTRAHLPSGVPWVLRARYRSTEKTVEQQTVRVWEVEKGLSTLNFIKDGVLVDQQSLWDAPQPHHVSLHIFLNAANLQHDLTGFALVESPERQTASERGRELAEDLLKRYEHLDLPLDNAFPSISWSAWLMRLIFGLQNTDVIASPESRRLELEESYAVLRNLTG